MCGAGFIVCSGQHQITLSISTGSIVEVRGMYPQQVERCDLPLHSHFSPHNPTTKPSHKVCVRLIRKPIFTLNLHTFQNKIKIFLCRLCIMILFLSNMLLALQSWIISYKFLAAYHGAAIIHKKCQHCRVVEVFCIIYQLLIVHSALLHCDLYWQVYDIKSS